METCRVNFVHNQMYKVYDHFQNGKEQVGYVEIDKIYYIAEKYDISSVLLDAILNKHTDTINLIVKREYFISGTDYIERQYKVERVVPRIFSCGTVSYNIFIKDFDEENALYMSNDYLSSSLNECDKHIKKVSDKCLIDIGDKIKTRAEVQRYIDKEIDRTNEEFQQHIKEYIERQEVR